MHIDLNGRWQDIHGYVSELEAQGWHIDGDIDSDFTHSTVRMTDERKADESDDQAKTIR